MDKIIIYTDGACSGNPGPGGWGAVLRYGKHEKRIFGGDAQTTNNRMEIKAAIEAIKSVKKPLAIELHTDSTYLKKGITEWLPIWKKNGWHTSARKPVKNADLWQLLEEAVRNHNIKWLWVRGHDGNEGNELADMLANKGMDKVKGKA